MAAPGDVYERELKNLLSGDSKTIEKMIKTCDSFEKSAYMSLLDEPFVIIRAAGSLGVDLVALRWDYSFPIEVKSSSEDVMHFSKSQRLTEQADRMKEECMRAHLLPVYAYRLKNVKGDPWRIFALPTDDELRGSSGFLQRKVPTIEVNGNGNYIMRWERGMKLSEFVAYMQFNC